MSRLLAVLMIFGIGLAIGWSGQEPPKTETVFLTKWKTRVVEKTTVETRELPAECQDVFALLGDLQRPADIMSNTAGELQGYADRLGLVAFEDDVSKINTEMVRIRLAGDELGTAGIDIRLALEDINDQYLLCQQAIINTAQ